MHDCAKQFSIEGQSHETIVKHDEKAKCLLWSDKDDKSLLQMRCRSISSKTARASSFVDPKLLPPTPSATRFDSMGTYYQTMTWLGLEQGMNPLDWSWKSNNGQYVPIGMDIEPAPESLLIMVYCNCTTGCTTKRCRCRKTGVECNSGCGSCQNGESQCTNTTKVDDSDVDYDSN